MEQIAVVVGGGKHWGLSFVKVSQMRVIKWPLQTLMAAMPKQ